MTVSAVTKATPTPTLPLPVLPPDEPPPARWRVAVAVTAGLLAGVLIVAGVLLPW